MHTKLMLTTGIGFEGYRVTHYLGIISKEVVFRNGVGRTLDAAITNIADRLTFKDTELTGSTELIANAKSYLLERFEEEIRKKGANAALGIDFESSFGVDFVRVAMSGTPVIIEEIVEHDALHDSDEEGTARIGFVTSNVVDPFFPVMLEYNSVSRGIMASLRIRSVGIGTVSDIQADLTFTNRFDDTFSVKDYCFLDFEEDRRNESVSSWYTIELPESIYRCLKSCVILVKKYVVNGQLTEVSATEQVDLKDIAEVPSLDGLSILNSLEQYDNAHEMLEYIKSIESSLPEDLFCTLTETLQVWWDLERMYGADKKSTLAALERKLKGE